MVGLFDGKLDRNKEDVDREEILQWAFEAWSEGISFEKFIQDAIDFFDLSETEVTKILSGEIKSIKAHPYDL